MTILLQKNVSFLRINSREGIVEKYGIDESSIKDNHWYEMYFDLEQKIEEQQDANEKQEREIVRRTKRYNKNEIEYRKQIDQLQRELRVRKGYEKDAEKTNAAMQERIKTDIFKNIEDYDKELEKLKNEQMKELARKYKSEVAKTQKSIEEKKAQKGDQAAELKEKENELRHHLELITNIAQRIATENSSYIKKNAQLRAEFKA